MALRNRVTPFGELIADPGRGLVYGNRGCLHDERGRIRRPYDGKRWIACRLEFRGWNRGRLMQPGRFTELFFLDEATAMAAGHRPCALCRHEDYVRFVEIWRALHPGQVRADAIDAQLHRERLDPDARAQRRSRMTFEELPDGAFVLQEGEAKVVVGRRLLSWTLAGYRAPVPRPERGAAVILTPPSLISVLRRRWTPLVPLLHPSAFARTI
jgi:hypothetical protein